MLRYLWATSGGGGKGGKSGGGKGGKGGKSGGKGGKSGGKGGNLDSRSYSGLWSRCTERVHAVLSI